MPKAAEAAAGAPIDILVNNAGITRDNLFMRMKDEEWDQVIAVNLTAAFRLSRAVLRGMMKKRWGRIIQITSVVGTTGNPGQGNYAAAKAGLIGMTKSLAAEVASRNITVNAVAPGFIQTAMTDVLTDQQKEADRHPNPCWPHGQGRRKSPPPSSIWPSEEAAYVTGETIHVNGGMAMIMICEFNSLTALWRGRGDCVTNRPPTSHPQMVKKCGPGRSPELNRFRN